MKNRVYGLIGIGSYMSSWNADFTKHPKSLGDGRIFGSDKALKYSIRNYYVNNDKKVFAFKSFIEDKKKDFQTRTLTQRYEQIFSTVIDENTPSKEILKNLFSAEDVINFGATFAMSKDKDSNSDSDDKKSKEKNTKNISILGITQIGQGFNKYANTEVHTQDILSPFRNPNKDNASVSSLGTQTLTDEAHYLYPFSINPTALLVYKDLISNIEYSDENYRNFVNAATEGATLLNTTSKMGCNNELALFIKLNNDSKLYLPTLDDYVTFQKVDGKGIYDFTDITNILKEVDSNINDVTLYYDKLKINFKGLEGYNKYHKKDILTKKEIV